MQPPDIRRPFLLLLEVTKASYFFLFPFILSTKIFPSHSLTSKNWSMQTYDIQYL